MKYFQYLFCRSSCIALFADVATPILFIVAAGNSAHAQAYTYDTPTCGAIYREERAKPRALRVPWEITSADHCANQSKLQIACQHYQHALRAADRMEPEAGNGDDIKAYIRSRMQTFGCQ